MLLHQKLHIPQNSLLIDVAQLCVHACNSYIMSHHSLYIASYSVAYVQASYMYIAGGIQSLQLASYDACQCKAVCVECDLTKKPVITQRPGI